MASREKTIRGEVSPILTQFVVGYVSPQFIGRLVAPLVPSYAAAGTLYTFGKEGFYIYDTQRALRANANKIQFAISKDTYVCVEHALESSLDYKELEEAERIGAKEVLKLEQRTVMGIENAMTRKLEKEIADYIFGTSYYATGNKTTLSGGDQWSDPNNSDPVGNIDTGKIAARADMGIEPNTGVIGYTAWAKLKRHPQILDKIKYSQLGVSTVQLIKEIIELENLYIGMSNYAADDGTFTDLWTDSMALIYIPPKDQLVEGTTPHTILIEQKGYPEVKTYSMKKTIDYENTHKRVVKNISTSYGYLISDIIA